MTATELRRVYSERYESSLKPLAERIAEYLASCLSYCERIDRLTARAKDIDSFLTKAAKIEDGRAKYDDPINQIQDQVGARIITFYISDVDIIADAVESYCRPIESRTMVPESDSEFGYFGKHYVLLLPTDVIWESEKGLHPPFFELQIKTLFQHAWSQANHDLGYKAHVALTSQQKRKIAFSSAQAWGADQIFDQLRVELRDGTSTPDRLNTVPARNSPAYRMDGTGEGSD